jgi:hypothetical protein
MWQLIRLSQLQAIERFDLSRLAILPTRVIDFSNAA